jgi:Flp pilus assembly pilin Flp
MKRRPIMSKIELVLSRIPKDEKGVTTVEYAIMLVLVALAVAAFGAGLSGSVTGVFTRMITALAG